jgi:hypothetical protein
VKSTQLGAYIERDHGHEVDNVHWPCRVSQRLDHAPPPPRPEPARIAEQHAARGNEENEDEMMKMRMRMTMRISFVSQPQAFDL